MSDCAFYNENAHALKDVNVVLRDSLGTLAVSILETRPNFSNMSYADMLNELETIIRDLHHTYESQYRA